jgi:pyrroline-5-carboxylate reductase
MLQDVKIAFIGSGAMGEAMIKGLLARHMVKPGQMVASDPVEARRKQIAGDYGVVTTDNNLEAVAGATVVILSIKPQVLPAVLSHLRGHVAPDALVLSIIAGAPIATIREGLGHPCIVRSMPNTPAQVGKGVTVWAATSEVTEEQRKQTAEILGAFGEQLPVHDEGYLDMATGLSGSGPGFVFLLIEAMIDAGVHIGFSRADAQKMVLQTIDGSVELVRATGLHPAELRNRVTSPGGTTAAGLYEMENSGIRAAMTRAIQAAYRRSQELGAVSVQKEEKDK